MKKLVLSLLFVSCFCNASFARDYPLAKRVATLKEFTDNQLYRLVQQTVSCKITVTASKKNNFVEQKTCSNASLSVGCVTYSDKKVSKNYKPLPDETYCLSSLDNLALQNRSL